MGEAFQEGATCPHAEEGEFLLRILKSIMADSPISASGCVTETTRKCYSAKSIETASMPPRNAQTCLACFPRAITAVLCISSRTIKPYKSYSQAALQPPTQRASASASRNLLIISKRDPENSPAYSEFIYLCGHHWPAPIAQKPVILILSFDTHAQHITAG